MEVGVGSRDHMSNGQASSAAVKGAMLVSRLSCRR
jgi:hypothetical protein